MASINYTNDTIPNVSVNLQQVKSTSATQTIPFIPCIICKTPTGPTGVITAVNNYQEAVSTFGLGDESTPALYGVEQYLKTYNYANIIRVASSSANESEVTVVRTNGPAEEQVTTTTYVPATSFVPTESYFIQVDNVYQEATRFDLVTQGQYVEVDQGTAVFDPEETYYILVDEAYVVVSITEFDPEVVYYTYSSNFDPQTTYYTLSNGAFTTAVITEFDPEVDYYTDSTEAITVFKSNVNYFTAVTVTVDILGTILSGKSDYKTEIYNGDTISLVYNEIRGKWYITGTLNGTIYTTPKSTIDLSTATADEEEKVLDSLVKYWNALNTGITLKNEFINKVVTDKAIRATDLISGTVNSGDSGYTNISNEDVIGLFDLINDPTVQTQDVVCVPEFRNYNIVNAGLGIKNTYFYLVAAEGKTLDEKEEAIKNYDASDKGVMYIPDGCTLANPNIVVPFEIAALYAWASTYNLNRYYAPAGVKRAALTQVTSIINNLSDDDAVELYNLDIPANPVKYITNTGFCLYGQKTMDATQQFTNRINVANLVNYILVTGKELLQPFLFDYAPISTFEQIYLVLYDMMDKLATNDIVYNDFIITCDSSNNTDETLRAHELHASIAIRPINVIEYIYLDLTVTDDLTEEVGEE